MTKSGFVCYGNELKFNYERLQFQHFLGSLARAIKGKAGNGEGMGSVRKAYREKERGQWKRKRPGGEGRELAPKHTNLTPPMPDPQSFFSNSHIE